MELILPASTDETGSLRLGRSTPAGRNFRVRTQVCLNPVCDCGAITLHCAPDREDWREDSSDAAGFDLKWDLRGRRLANLGQFEADLTASAFAHTVADEIDDAGWKTLRKAYWEAKSAQTAGTDLEQIEARFPEEALKDPSMTVGYSEIVPFGARIDVQIGDRLWIVDDAYCINPECGCRSVVLSFLPIPAQGSNDGPRGVLEPNHVLRYDYGTGATEPIESPSGRGAIPGADLLASFKAKSPDLDRLLAQRHGLLQRLYRKVTRRQPVLLPIQKTGRNDRCPCGSGKKYKKCCGRQ